jgi:abortive infection bacteriophage resistance protein
MKLMTIFRKITFSIFDFKKKSCIFASTNSATLPIEQRTRAELLLLYLMEYSKSPISYIQQIAILKERGLLIQNEEQALKELHIISYFRLANYWRPMELDKTTHQFKPNSYFENALSLYYFDKKLRTLVFTAIQSIEIALRTQMIHHISMKYGAFWFMDKTICGDEKMFQDNLTRIQQEVKRSKEDFIQEHFLKYNSPSLPPVWKTLEVISFGTLSKLYCNLADNTVKKQIAREFNLPQHLYLESWIKCAAVLRNCVAHHARIWNRRFPLKPQLPRKLKSPWIDVSRTEQVKFYAQLCYLAYLQDCIHPDNTFKRDLQDTLIL